MISAIHSEKPYANASNATTVRRQLPDFLVHSCMKPHTELEAITFTPLNDTARAMIGLTSVVNPINGVWYITSDDEAENLFELIDAANLSTLTMG